MLSFKRIAGSSSSSQAPFSVSSTPHLWRHPPLWPPVSDRAWPPICWIPNGGP
ncbi:hypothetical protein OIU79_007597 [Salix purpurea]|uniref:Uncharacterized protein n=1 Tax=Salix purpurea TaxID=77065 RepID=A0A9Q0TGD6_SALPP|nr:hypothetical protein OIU79_007597 [Salix purpurea]